MQPARSQENRDWQYVLAVRDTTSAYPGDAQPVIRSLGGGPGRPPQARLPRPAPPYHPRRGRPGLLHQTQDGPKAPLRRDDPLPALALATPSGTSQRGLRGPGWRLAGGFPLTPPSLHDDASVAQPIEQVSAL